MKRVHYLAKSEEVSNAAESFLDEVSEALDARNVFANKYKSDGVKIFQTISTDGDVPVVISVTGLRFGSRMPPGFISSENHLGYAIPDPSTDRGRELSVELAALPVIPLANDLASILEYGSPLRLIEGGATAISVEKIDDNFVIHVPVFSADEIDKDPSYQWTCPDIGLELISEIDYKEMKSLSFESVAGSSLSPRMR